MSVPDAAYLMKLPPEERRAQVDAALNAVREVSAEMIAEARRPRSFKDYPPWKKAVMTVVQHAAGPNSITVSHDGKIEGAWRLPLTYTKAPRTGQTIVSIHHTEIEFQPEPLRLGFLLIVVPGWLASKQELCQASSPHLSADIEWSEAQQEAWARLRRAFDRMNAAEDRAKNEMQRQRRYDAERAERIAAGNYTISDLARGRSRSPR